MSARDDGAKPAARVLVCTNRAFRKDLPSCGAGGGDRIADALEAGLRERGLLGHVERINCFGRCALGPNVRVLGGRFLTGMDVSRVPEVLDLIAESAPAPGDSGEESEQPRFFPGG